MWLPRLACKLIRSVSLCDACFRIACAFCAAVPHKVLLGRPAVGAFGVSFRKKELRRDIHISLCPFVRSRCRILSPFLSSLKLLYCCKILQDAHTNLHLHLLTQKKVGMRGFRLDVREECHRAVENTTKPIKNLRAPCKCISVSLSKKKSKQS